MSVERMIADGLLEGTEILDEVIAESVAELEREFGRPDLVFRERLRVWRIEKINELEARLRAAANRLN